MIITGDFNDITSNEEKYGGKAREDWSFGNFRSFIDENKLIDIGFEDNPSIWCNNWKNKGHVRQRLDRTLCSLN